MKWISAVGYIDGIIHRTRARSPRLRAPFYLNCNGSGDGLGDFLQPYEDGERVIAYSSRSLHDHEKKWTATGHEAPAVIWALESFLHYTDTVEVCIRTDHASTHAITALSAAALNAGRCGSRNSDSKCSIAPSPSRNTSTASREHPSRSLRINPPWFSTNSPTAQSSLPALPRRPRSLRNCGVTPYAPLTRSWQRRPTRAPVCSATASSIYASEQHADPGGASLASTDDDADVEVYLTDTEDEATPARLLPYT
ncbi:hypothetical protein ACSSS7_004975 [Eimeria intestinalis]